MSSIDLLHHPPPAPARPRRKGGLHWFRLVVVALILAAILAALPGLAWSKLAAYVKKHRPSEASREGRAQR